MSEEEKQLTEALELEIQRLEKVSTSLKGTYTPLETLVMILNLIKSQQEEIGILKSKRVNMFEQLDCIEKKNKIIDLMLDMLVRVHSENKQIEFIANYNVEEKKEQLKQYFEKKVEGSNAK